MRSSPETTTRTTGAHRAHREARDRTAARNLAHRPPTRVDAYDAYLDGLFTYCLSVLCDHGAATAALADALALAERRAHRGPGAEGDRRAWLYALARWACLRKLAEDRQKRPATHAAGRPAPTAPGGSRDQLALLAWPEAAGTTPEQREALELAVRHHLAPSEVAAVLGTDLAPTRELLASAACEVERTRAALAVVRTGTCAGVSRLTGDNRYVLSAALRRELVRHVDDCPRCRRTAERAIPGRWPGTSVTPAELPVLQAPRAALHLAVSHLPRARVTAPRFDRRGFPMDPKDRAARRDRLRARAVTTTVVATVVAAPVLALWAAYRGTPVVEGEDGRSTSASEAQSPDGHGGPADHGYENAGNASTTPGTGFDGEGGADVSVEVVSVTGAGEQGAGHLKVTAAHQGDTTLITLTAAGDAPVRWSASAGSAWLRLSRSAGTLRPGQTQTIRVYVDHAREPAGRWSARVAVSPAAAVVTIQGHGATVPAPTRPGPRPGPPDDTASPSHPDPDPTTSQPGGSAPPPGPTPTDDPPPTTPDPDPTPPPTGGTGDPPPSGTGEPSPSAS